MDAGELVGRLVVRSSAGVLIRSSKGSGAALTWQDIAGSFAGGDSPALLQLGYLCVRAKYVGDNADTRAALALLTKTLEAADLPDELPASVLAEAVLFEFCWKGICSQCQGRGEVGKRVPVACRRCEGAGRVQMSQRARQANLQAHRRSWPRLRAHYEAALSRVHEAVAEVDAWARKRLH